MQINIHRTGSQKGYSSIFDIYFSLPFPFRSQGQKKKKKLSNNRIASLFPVLVKSGQYNPGRPLAQARPIKVHTATHTPSIFILHNTGGK